MFKKALVLVGAALFAAWALVSCGTDTSLPTETGCNASLPCSVSTDIN